MRPLSNFIVVICFFVLAPPTAFSNPGKHTLEQKLFHIESDALKKGILHIHLPVSHPKCLAIRSPEGEWYVLQNSDESIKVMSQVDFDSTTEMKFNIAELKGVTWRESEKVAERIFTISGNYLIYFADNLETEPENTYSFQETIYFKKRE